MTHAEYKTWLDYHCSRFTDLRRLVFFDFCTEDDDDRNHRRWKATANAWYDDVLKSYTLKDCQAASRMMIASEDLQPRNFTAHPAAVANLAQKVADENKRFQKEKPNGADGPRKVSIGTRVTAQGFSGTVCFCNFQGGTMKMKLDQPTHIDGERRTHITVFDNAFEVEEA